MERNRIDNELKVLMNKAFYIREQNFSNVIYFDTPENTCVLSVTGNNCSLKCAHCNGVYLRNMKPIENFSKYIDKYESFLISGGCDKNGALYIKNKKIYMKEIKESNKKINLHSGLLNDENIFEAADVISFDFVMDDETIQSVYKLNKSGSDYIQAYLKLKEKIKTIPHICIGIYGGKIKGEYLAISKLKDLGADTVVFIIFVPTEGTEFSNKKMVRLEEIIEVLTYARISLPKAQINLGCMRPKGKYREQVDYYSLMCGVNKIVNPTKKTVDKAKELGLKIIYGRECCVF